MIVKSAERKELEEKLANLGAARIEAVKIRDQMVGLKMHLDEEWIRVEAKLRALRAKERG